MHVRIIIVPQSQQGSAIPDVLRGLLWSPHLDVRVDVVSESTLLLLVVRAQCMECQPRGHCGTPPRCKEMQIASWPSNRESGGVVLSGPSAEAPAHLRDGMLSSAAP